jgi:hypothetical protein
MEIPTIAPVLKDFFFGTGLAVRTGVDVFSLTLGEAFADALRETFAGEVTGRCDRFGVKETIGDRDRRGEADACGDSVASGEADIVLVGVLETLDVGVRD